MDSDVVQSYEDQPTLPDGFERIDPRSITVERIGWSILLGFVTAGSGGVLFAAYPWSGAGNWTAWLVLLAIAVALIGLTVFMLLWMPRRDYLAKKLRLDQLGIEIHSGVFWKRRQYVPRSRIQHTDVSQGPLQRRFELGAMTLHTAGTHNATIRIDGLSHTRANELRDQLVLPRDNAA